MKHNITTTDCKACKRKQSVYICLLCDWWVCVMCEETSKELCVGTD